VKDIDILVDFVSGNSKKLQKLGLEGKINWAVDVYTLQNFKIFNSENVKNKECIHTWANSTSYISCHEQTMNRDFFSHALILGCPIYSMNPL
jgi:hypothetical protein